MTSSRPLVNSIPLLVLSLFAITGCSREKGDWRTAQAADSPESYQQFIDEHPESSYVADARERLQQLVEEKDWRAAAETDSLEAYRQFITQYPSGKWAKEARVRIDGFSSPAGAATGAASDAGVAAGAPGAAASVPDAAAGTPPAIAASGFGVQLGAFSSAERANEEWKKLQADAAGMLDGLAPRVVVGEASGKTLYRLQAEVRDEAQARAICGGLKVAKKPCVPVIPH